MNHLTARAVIRQLHIACIWTTTHARKIHTFEVLTVIIQSWKNYNPYLFQNFSQGYTIVSHHKVRQLANIPNSIQYFFKVLKTNFEIRYFFNTFSITWELCGWKLGTVKTQAPRGVASATHRVQPRPSKATRRPRCNVSMADSPTSQQFKLGS